MKQARRFFTGWRVAVMFVALLVIVPLGVILLSFLSPEKEIWQHLLETLMARLVLNTVLLVSGVALCTMLLGVSLAWLTGACDFPGRSLFSWSLLLPMAMPTYVLAFVWVGIFDFTGPVQTLLRDIFGQGLRLPDIRSTAGVILVMSFALYPYVYLLTKNGFSTQGARALEAAQSLGCRPLAGFFRVALPMARPWISAGVLLVIMESLADFGAVSIFNYDTFTTAIYKAWFGFFSLAAAAQLSSILVLIVFVIMELEHQSSKRLRYHQSERQQSKAPPIVLNGLWKWLATALCSLVLLCGFVLPLIQLLVWSIEAYGEEFSSSYLRLLGNSLLLGSVAALIIVSLAFVLAYAKRRHPDNLTQTLIRLATLGYGLPGTVLAIGIFIPIAATDNFLAGLLTSISGYEVRPFLQGTILVMLLAYTIRFMAAGFKGVDSAMHRITPSIDEAARLMGLRGLKILGKVHLPILKGGALTALTVVFVDVMKEMPITLMTRPFGWDTLSVKIFELTSEGEWERAAIPAVSLIVVGILPIILFMRNSEK